MENVELLLILIGSYIGLGLTFLYFINQKLGDIKEILESRKEKS